MNKTSSLRVIPWKRGARVAYLAFLLLLLITLGFAGFWVAKAEAAAGINEQINFQGRLLTSAGAVVPDGNYNMRFKVYQDGDGCVGGGSAPCSGTLEWTETHQNSASQGVVVKNGYFSVQLGSITAFASSIDWNQSVLWLSIDIGGTTTGGSPAYDGEMTPFTRLSSVPYALNAGQLGGLAAGNFVQLAQGLQTDGSTSNASIAINKTGGTADIIDLQRGGASVFNISNAGSTLFQNSSDSTTAFQIQNAAGTSNLFVADTTNTRVGIGALPANGVLTIGTNTTAASGGLYFGTDVNLYRLGANELKTDDYLFSGAQIAAEHGGSAQTRIGAVGPSGESAIVFGFDNADPVNLYRSAANTLKTDDYFIQQNTANSTTAFQVQNATGGQLFNIDSTNANITLNGLNTGETQAWQTNANALPAARSGAGTAIAGGYAYVTGGSLEPGTQTTVYYGLVNADGSIGTWDVTTALPAARAYHTTVAANGYLYVIGGDNSGAQSTVYYAKLNSNGTVGSWNTTTALPSARVDHSSIVASGYVYVIGGYNGSAQSTVYYAKLNADGTVGSWNTTTALPSARGDGAAATANGYAYYIGGDNGGAQSTVYYGKVDADGTIASWSTGTALPSAIFAPAAAVANGYIYSIGGGGSSAVYYSQLNANGSNGSWTTNTNALPAARNDPISAVANGYIYAIGGNGGAAVDTVYYSSTSRIKLAGALDLVGLSGENLAEGGTGGSITAGNGIFVGDLQVQGQASFAQGVVVKGNLTNSGQALFQNSTNSTSGFQIQDSAGSNLFTADTTNSQLIVTDLSPTDSTTVASNLLTTVDGTGANGDFSAIAIGGDGFARISYYDLSNDDLEFAQCNDDDCSSPTLTTVDSTGNVGAANSIAIGGDGFARIAYYDTTNTSLKFAQCTNASCSTSNITTVDNAASVGTNNSIAIGGDGFARIAYFDDTNSALKFAQCTNAACTTSNITTVDTNVNGDPALGIGQAKTISIGIASDGFVRISYVGNSGSDLMYAQCTNDACTTSNLGTVASGGVNLFPYASSLQVGSDDFGRIAYLDINASTFVFSLKYVQCTNADCSSSNISTIQSVASSQPVPIDASLAINGSNLGRIGYIVTGFFSATSTTLRYVECTSASCSTSNLATIQSLGVAPGAYTDSLVSGIALGGDGFARISYPYFSGGILTPVELKYARLASANGQRVVSGINIGSSSDQFASLNTTAVNSQYFTLRPDNDEINIAQIQDSSGNILFNVDSVTSTVQLTNTQINGNLNATGTSAVLNYGTAAGIITDNFELQNNGGDSLIQAQSGIILNICNSFDCDTVNVATNTDADTVNIGDSNDTIAITGSTLTLQGGTGSTAVRVQAGASGTINIGASASAQVINIGTGAAAQTITIGSTTSGSTLALTSAASGITIGDTGTALSAIKSQTFNWNPPSTNNGASSTTTLSLSEAGAIIAVYFPHSFAGTTCGLCWWSTDASNVDGPWYFASDNITVGFTNASGSTQNPSAADFIVWYIKP